MSQFCSSAAAVAPQVTPAQPVGVPAEAEDLGAMDESVQHGGGHDVGPKTWPERPTGLVEATIKEARRRGR